MIHKHLSASLELHYGASVSHERTHVLLQLGNGMDQVRVRLTSDEVDELIADLERNKIRLCGLTLDELKLARDCTALLCKEFNCDLEVVSGKHNQLEYIEEVLGINDVRDKLVLTVTPPLQIDWLKLIVKQAEENKSILYTERSLSDRKSINERYGF